MDIGYIMIMMMYEINILLILQNKSVDVVLVLLKGGGAL